MDMDDVALSIYRNLAGHPLTGPAAGLWNALTQEKLKKLDLWQVLKGGLEGGLVPWPVADAESVLERVQKKHEELLGLQAEAEVPCDLVRAGEIAIHVESLLADVDAMRLLRVSRTYGVGSAGNQPDPPAVAGVKHLSRQFGAFISAFADSVVQLTDALDRVLDKEDRDPLTGAYSRQALFQHGKFLVEWAVRYSRSLGVLTMKVDDFPSVVRQFGHTAADELLEAVHSRIRSVTRRTDWVVRSASDEFTVLILGTPPAGLRIVSDKILSQVRHPTFRIGRFEIPATASGGLALCREGGPSDDPSIEQLLDRAARFLDQARSTGGNALVVEE
jgi:diguanylate cyclase (GGDEF)-like protein